MSLTDFRSVLQVLTKIQPDEVYNLAGQTSVGLSFGQPVETLESIATGTLNLLEAIRFLGATIKLYIDFNVNVEQGLNGFCDFLIGLSSQQLYVTSPVIALVEAKNDNLKQGFAQCIAEMIAAAQLNQSEGNNVENIYGCVTNGNQWVFLQLTGNLVVVDLDEYYINQPEKIISVFVSLIKSESNRKQI
ncbi:MAG: GDP-mannose 4,6-dehydratase [Dolichospermum sp. BR01]|nr:GDP-mannose 4,6-dehydratase [Dolichospermum sp. BR01]